MPANKIKMPNSIPDTGIAIGEVVKRAFVVAYRENVDFLVAALQREGLQTTVIREPLNGDDAEYGPTLGVLRTHLNVWTKCAAGDEIVAVAEADFVPAVGMASQFLPFDIRKADHAFGYLYACGPELYDLQENGYARGHAGGAVGYLLTPVVAQELVAFASDLLHKTPPKQYTPWDTMLGFYLKERGIQSYIPFRMLGEHGGKANPQHRLAGLASLHRADTLCNRLHFLPNYAESSIIRYCISRIYARIYGLGRLVTFRYLHFRDFWSAESKLRLLRYIIGRQLSIW